MARKQKRAPAATSRPGGAQAAVLRPLDLTRQVQWAGGRPDADAAGAVAGNRRVLHLVNGEHYSGAERVQDLLALRLPEFGFDVGFACLKPGKFSAARRSQEAPLVELPMRSRLDLRPVFQLARLLRRQRYSLLHTHTPRAALVGRLAAKMAGVPMVHHIHSPTSADSTRRIQNYCNTLGEWLALLRVPAVIAVSNSLGRYARRQGIPDKAVNVVPNGVPVVGPLPRRRAPHGQWTLGTVALFRPRKGLEVLLDALAMLRAKRLSVTLRAVGGFETPEYRAEILHRVDQLGLADAIEWTGFTTDVQAEFKKMDVFVLPSLFGEGLPMVILEAMAAGVPVVASRVEGIPEVIRDGDEGLVVAPGDAGELSRAIEQIVAGKSDWSELRHAAHIRQAEQFSDEAMARKVADVYRGVLASRRESIPLDRSDSGDNTPPRVSLFGAKIDAVRMPEAVSRILDWVDKPAEVCRYVVTPNVDHAVMLQVNASLRAAYSKAAMVLADGAPVVVASRLLGKRLPERVAGSDLVPTIFAAAALPGRRALRTFLLGSAPGVAQRAAQRIEAQWPGVSIVGTNCPPLGFEKDPDQNKQILKQIAAARPDLLLIGLGAPKQELWVHAQQSHLNASVALCIGATIDFLAGERSRAPVWMRRSGIEWLHRLASEPRRLWRRYLRDACVFPRLLWHELRTPQA